MSFWTTITVDDLNDTKAAALVDALRTAALAVSQDDPTPSIVSNVVARVRTEIAACKANLLDSDTGKVPNELKSLTCRMILREMQSRLFLPLNVDEKNEMKADIRLLERIAKCEVPVSTPDNATTPSIQEAFANPSITEDRNAEFKRASQDGL